MGGSFGCAHLGELEGLLRAGTPFHSSHGCSGASAALQRDGEMGANNGYDALARPCSPAQVYWREASWGGVKFGLLDILELPSEDNN